MDHSLWRRQLAIDLSAVSLIHGHLELCLRHESLICSQELLLLLMLRVDLSDSWTLDQGMDLSLRLRLDDSCVGR